MKQFTKLEKARMLRAAHNISPFIRQRNNLQSQIDILTEQKEKIQSCIDTLDQTTFDLTGYHSEDIIKKVKVPTNKINTKGEPVYISKYQFIYPETIIPTENSEV